MSFINLVRKVVRKYPKLKIFLIFAMFRLVSQLEERVKTVSEEISSLEGVDRRLEELQDKMSRLARQLGGLMVWDQDHANTDQKLLVRLLLSCNYTSTVRPELQRCLIFSECSLCIILTFLEMISIPRSQF